MTPKGGQLSPGTHIPIADEAYIDAESGYYLVLAWNYFNHFIETKRRFLGAVRKLIIPVPAPRIISADDIFF